MVVDSWSTCSAGNQREAYSRVGQETRRPMVGSSRDPYESRVRTHGTPTWRKRNHSRASSFHLPPSSFLPTPRRIEARLTIEERNQGNGGEKERRCKYPGEFISRRDYQTGADTRIPSSHNSRPSRRSRLRGCVYTYIHTYT